jgi:hypothetical protein
MAKPNYQFQKRQKDLAKKQKQEEKRQRKLEKSVVQPAENPDRQPGEGKSGTPSNEQPV